MANVKWADDPPDAPDPAADVPNTGSVHWADDPVADVASQPPAVRQPVKRPPVNPPAGPTPPPPPPKQSTYATAYALAGKPPTDKELSLGEALGQAAGNFLPSTAEGVKGMVHSVTHLGETVHNLGQLGGGLLSQAQGAIGIQQDPKEKAANEQMIKAVEDHYGNAYGSWKGFKQNLATDPFGVLMDASVIADPAAGALGKLADASKAGSIGAKAAGVASKVLENSNPINAAVNTAKGLTSKGLETVRALHGASSNVPPEVLKMVNSIAQSPNPAVRDTFKQFASGQGDAVDFAQRAQDGLSKIRDDVSANYLAKKQTLKPVAPDFDIIQNAIDGVKAKTQFGGTQFPNQFNASNDAVAKAEQLVNDYRTSTNPAHQSLDGVDNLKQAIYALHDATSDATARGHLMKIYHGAKDALVKADPDYAKLMENYTTGLQNVSDLTKTLGLGPNASATTTFAKNLRALKTPTSGNLLGQLMEKDPTIGAALAGSAVHPWGKGGRPLTEGMLGSVAGAALSGGNPIGAMVGAGAGALASSPKAAGLLQTGFGKATVPANALKNALKNPVAQKGVYAASRPEQLQPQTVSSDPDHAPAADAPNPPGAESSPQSDAEWVKQFVGEGSPADAPTGTPDVEALKQQIAAQESGGHKDPYTVVGPHSSSGDKPYGKYQVMGHNIPIWTKEVLGRAMTPEEFMASPEAQEAVASAKLSEYLAKTGNVRDAAAMWHSGKTYDVAKAQNRRDVLGTHTTDYADRAAESMGLFKGGRVGRAEGGKVDDDAVERLSNLLMTRVHAAKKAENKRTEPLLNQPDEHIVRALNVAQRAI